MDYTQISIIKRDGKTEPFSLDKIVRAITKAFRAVSYTHLTLPTTPYV